MTAPAALVAAWQRALEAEQQAAFGYALLGPHLPDSRQDLARSCQALHESLRDTTAAAIEAAGARPAPPAGDYPALYDVAPVELAATLEDDCAEGWRYFYAGAATAGSAGDRYRAGALRALTASAVRATKWRLISGKGRAVTAFPGTTPAR